MEDATTHPAEADGGEEVAPVEEAPLVGLNDNNCNVHCVGAGVWARHTQLTVVLVAPAPANSYQRLG